MSQLNKRILHLELPDRMKRLPISDEGYPIPYFVGSVDGKADFRCADPEKFVICVRHERCWLCGEPLGVRRTFVIGPMCVVNTNTAEPPCHYDCALYSTRACPFLTMPRMRRNEKAMPEGHSVAGIAIKRNPGVVVLWTTGNYRRRRDPNGMGLLFDLELLPERVEFFAEGRPATRKEIMESMNTGMPILRGMADQDRDPADAHAELDLRWDRAIKLVPA
jgi:hypothetical protein